MSFQSTVRQVHTQMRLFRCHSSPAPLNLTKIQCWNGCINAMISVHIGGWMARNSHWYWCVPAVLKSIWDSVGSHRLISPSYSCAWAVPSPLPSSSPAPCNGWVILFSLRERNGLFSTDHPFSSHFLPVHTNGQFSLSEIRLVGYNWCICLRLNNQYILTCPYHETITTVHRFIILNCFFSLYYCSHASFSLALSQENH